MDSQKANGAEVTEHSVQGTLAIFADDFTDGKWGKARNI